MNIDIIDVNKGSLEINHNEGILVDKFCFFPLTYQKGSRLVFYTSKRQATMPSTSSQPLDKGKQRVKEEEEDHEVERDFDIIQVDSDEENEARITNMLLQDRNAQIKYIQAHSDRAKSINDAIDLENRQLGAQIAIYEARSIKAQK